MNRSLMVILVAGLQAHFVVNGDETPIFGLVEFQSLSEVERREFIVRQFESRMSACLNATYECDVVCRTQRRDDNEFGEVIAPEWKTSYRRYRDGDSYRVVRSGFGRTDKPLKRTECGFDAREGVSRMKETIASGTVFGRIDSEHDSINAGDNYSYWFNGPQLLDSEYIFPYFLDHRDAWKVSMTEENLIKVIAPWMPRATRDTQYGEYALWLDPEKGYLPIQGSSRWDRPGGSWRTVEFTVESAKEFGELWMPVKLIEITGSSSIGRYDASLKDVVSICETTVRDLEFGSVTGMDLEVIFPAGTKVVDALRGVTYVVGSANQEEDVEPLFAGSRPILESVASGADQGRNWLVILNLGVGLMVLVYMLFRRSLFRRRQTEEPKLE